MNEPNRFNPRSFRARASAAVPLLRMRYWMVCLGFLVWATLIFSKFFWLQILRHNEFLDRAQKQQQHSIELAPRRGVLYDRNLRELAMTVQADSVFAVPSQIDDKDKKATVHALAQIVHVGGDSSPVDAWTSEAQILSRVNASKGFAWIARRLSPAQAAQVKALNLKGIYFQKEFQRFYPGSETAAQVLGYVGVDDNGLGGMEQKFDGRLHGESGRMFAAVDARRHVMQSTEREPQPGENLVLTLDETIQFMAEKALDAAMARTHADTGTVVVQDVHTGQILALAVRPTFNPNDFRHTTPALLRDHAVSDVYEPGSTFKLVTYAAALDQHIVKPDDMIDCQGGAITFNGRTIHDDKSDHYGVIPVHEALEHSSDVAAVKLALRMGPDHFYNYIHSFGFGVRSGLELPGETRGLLRIPAHWGSTSIGSIAMGQEIAVTPLQLVSMVSTIANGGVYLPPHVVLTTQAKDGKILPQPGSSSTAQSATPGSQLVPQPFHLGEELPEQLPNGAHRVLSTMAAAQMRKMMEGVVLYGTGKPAQLNGYSSGGKTGTAQKIDPATHAYSKTMHVGSFAGIAPINNPVIAVAVILDNPKGAGNAYYGGPAAAPVFTQVAQDALEYLGVPHDIEVHAPRASTKEPGNKEAEPEQQHTGDVNALIAAVNDLPTDDPLREAVSQAREAAKAPSLVRVNVSDKKDKQGKQETKPPKDEKPVPATLSAQSKPSDPAPEVIALAKPAANSIKVPSLIGMPMRQLVEEANNFGLNLTVEGRGLVRSQQPAAGSQVQPGTPILVHCAR